MTLRKALASLLAGALLFLTAVANPQPVQAQILHNDQFAFFAKDENDTEHPYCQALLAAQGKYNLVGVNIYQFHLMSVEQAARVFEYLQKCGANVVRVFGANTIAEMDATATLIQSAPAGMSFVVAISNPVTGEGQTSRMYTDRSAWFGGAGATAYYNWATQAAASLQAAKSRISIIEMANEPHCAGTPGCIDPFAAWSNRSVEILKTVAPVSVGGGLLDIGTNGVESVNGGASAPIQRANANTDYVSVHWYPETEPEKAGTIDAVMSMFGKGKVYIGEVGYNCQSTPCTTASPEVLAANAAKLQSEVIDRYAGAHGLIYWSFAGFLDGDPGGTPLAVEDPNSLFIYPYNVDDLSKYFANTQVYCAPQQLYLEKAAAPPPPLRRIGIRELVGVEPVRQTLLQVHKLLEEVFSMKPGVLH